MAETISPISMKMAVDLSDFSPKLKTATKDMEDFGNRSKESAEKMANSFTSAQSRVTGFFNGFGGGGSNSASSALSALTGQLDGFLSKLGGAGPWGAFAAGGVAAFTAIGGAITRTAGQVADMNRTGRLLGTNNEDTQVLSEVFRRAGLDNESSQQALLKFSSHLGTAANDENSAEAASFHRIGLDPAALAQRSRVDALERTFQQLRTITNRADQDSAAQAMFSKRFVDLEPIIQRPDTFDRARATVHVAGISDSTSEAAREAMRLRHDTEDANNLSGGTFFQRVNRGWTEASTHADRFFAIVGRGASGSSSTPIEQSLIDLISGRATSQWGAGGPPPVRPETPAVRPPLAPDLYTPAAVKTSSQLAAEKLAETWRTGIEFFGIAQRKAEILQAALAGVDQQTLRMLEKRNQLLTDLEDRAKLEKEIVGYASQGQTEYEKQVESIRRIEEAHRRVDQLLKGKPAAQADAHRNLDNAMVSQFLAMERSLGTGPSSYAIGGIDPRSQEGARFNADLEVRNKVGLEGGDEADRVVRVLDLIREQGAEAQRQRDRLREAIEALGEGGLLPAPNF